jgi:hypothetical protein
MQRPRLVLRAVTAVLVSAVLVVGCVTKAHGQTGPRRTHNNAVAMVSAGPLPDAPPNVNVAPLEGMESRVRQATSEAVDKGAEISVVVLDRETGRLVSNGDSSPFPIASVAKLFVADDLLLQAAKAQTELSPADRAALDVMLRSSDDGAAEDFWNRNGGSAIVQRVTQRYGLTATSTPYDGHWYNTLSTASDLVRYYDMLLTGSGGLPAEQASIILSDLAQSTPTGVDGYSQRFGIPDGLYAEPVAVKQGWMCCWNSGNWMHMSTGVIGADRRFVMAIGSLQPSDDTTARNTITQAVKTMFPGGSI